MRAIPYIIRKLHDFVTLPPLGGPGVVVRCFIERNRKFGGPLPHALADEAEAPPLPSAGKFGGLYPRYMLYADYEDGQGRPLLIAVKKQSSTSHYVITTSEDDCSKRRADLRASRHYLGACGASFLPTRARRATTSASRG